MLSVTPQDVLGSFLCEVVSGGGFDRRYMANFKKEAARALGKPMDDCMTTNLCDPIISDAQIRCLDDDFPSGGFLLGYLHKYGNRSLACPNLLRQWRDENNEESYGLPGPPVPGSAG